MNQNNKPQDQLLYQDEPVKPGQYLSPKQQLQYVTEDMKHDCCCNCRFWDEYEPPSWDRTSVEAGYARVYYEGSCRHNPPVMLQYQHPDGFEPTEAFFPATKDREWCGRFERVD